MVLFEQVSDVAQVFRANAFRKDWFKADADISLANIFEYFCIFFSCIGRTCQNKFIYDKC